MEASKLVSIGYIPKPGETLDEFLTSGASWCKANQEFKKDLNLNPQITLNSVNIYLQNYDSVKLLENPKQKHLNLLGVTNPQFPIILYEPETPQEPITIGVKYCNVQLPIILIKQSDEEEEKIHEISHCLRNRFYTKIIHRTRNEIYDEYLAYNSTMHKSSFLPFIRYVQEKHPRFTQFTRKLMNSYSNFTTKYDKKTMLLLGHKLSYKEFIDLNTALTSGETLQSIINNKIKKSKKEYKWRWESILKQISQ